MDIWSRYEAAPVDVFQLSVGVIETPVALSAGETSAGANGGAMTVVNCRDVEYELVPLTFVALTLQ